MAALRERTEVVLIDAPAALHVGDVVSLSSLADGILVVARPTALRRQTLAELTRLLSLVRTPALGFVATGENDGESYAVGSASGAHRSTRVRNRGGLRADERVGSNTAAAEPAAPGRAADNGRRPYAADPRPPATHRGRQAARLALAADAACCRRGRSRERPPAGAMGSAFGRRCRRVLAGNGDLRLLAHDPGVDRDHEALRTLRPRRRARQPLDRRRLRRCLPHGHGLHVARHRRHVPQRHRESDRAEARGVLGLRDRVRLSCPGRSTGVGAPQRGLRPEHRHRRRRRRRPAVREEVPTTIRSTESIWSGSSTPSRRSARATSETWRCSATRATPGDRPPARRRARDRRLLERIA